MLLFALDLPSLTPISLNGILAKHAVSYRDPGKSSTGENMEIAVTKCDVVCQEIRSSLNLPPIPSQEQI